MTFFFVLKNGRPTTVQEAESHNSNSNNNDNDNNVIITTGKDNNNVRPSGGPPVARLPACGHRGVNTAASLVRRIDVTGPPNAPNGRARRRFVNNNHIPTSVRTIIILLR